MYKTILTNFNNVIYEGVDQMMAIAKAQLSGFEAVVYAPDGKVMSYSPISGWKGM
jgi:hypothetical protein